MAIVKPFRAIRPAEQYVKEVAALPYDVYSREEARAAVAGHPLSFLNIDRPETQFPEDHDMYAEDVYEKADAMLRQQCRDGIYVKEDRAGYYVYELTMDGRTQTGIVALSSVDDYLHDVCRKHENTVEKKELDRIRHVDTVSAQTGPIFLAYRAREEIQAITKKAKEQNALYDFTAEDGIRHRVFRIDDETMVEALESAFQQVPFTYIADGHHRAASAVKVALKRRQQHPEYTGKEEFNYFLSVLFPDNELKILDYNRVVKDLNGWTPADFMESLEESFTVTQVTTAFTPKQKGEILLYISGEWFLLHAKEAVLETRKDDPVRSLDVALLQEVVLEPLLGIGDPRTDPRISFVGGIRGLKELEKQVDRNTYQHSMDGTLDRVGPACAFAMHPTAIGELLAVADAKRLMPPKSTWFEPKLRSGIFIHEIER